MKYSTAIASIAGLAAAASNAQCPDATSLTSPVLLPSRGGRAVCLSGYFPVKASTNKNMKFNFNIPQNQTAVTQVFLNLVTSGSTFLKQIMAGTQTVSGTYQIYGSLCGPTNSTPTSLQFLTHGVGFDRTYWDFAPGYSYVDVAADAGYATFTYDRLGVGMSDHPDPLNVVQGALEVEIANSLAQSLRKGAIGGKSFSKVTGVGHSFGSIITNGVTGLYPGTFDGAILTGFSTNMTGIPPFITGLQIGIAEQSMPGRFAGLSPGYLIGSGPASTQTAFLHFPGFAQSIANAAAATAQTTTYGELFTQGTIAGPALNYTGPVAVVNGLEDLPFCSGNCSYPTDLALAAVKLLYPATKNGTSYLAPDSGHGLNFHYNALPAFQWVQRFIKGNGL